MSKSSHFLVDFARKLVRVRVESFLIPFVSGITEHDTLITSTEVIFTLNSVSVDGSGDVSILSFNNLDDFAFVSIKTVGSGSKSNLVSGGSDTLIPVNLLGGDVGLSHKADDVRLASGFHGDLSGGVNSNASIQDGVRNLIAEFVGVTFSNRL